MALIGTVGTVKSQVSPSAAFAASFAYLAEVLRPGSAAAVRLQGIAEGETQRIELAEGAFALEQVYMSKLRADGFFESHRSYIDVQVIVAGEEWMEIEDVARAVVRQPYQEPRDLIVYEDVPGASLLHLRAGDAAVFFPADVHMPGLCGGAGRGLVRKTVIKVPVAGR